MIKGERDKTLAIVTVHKASQLQWDLNSFGNLSGFVFFLQMFIIKSVSGEHVDLDAFDISGSKYTPEGEV